MATTTEPQGAAIAVAPPVQYPDVPQIELPKGESKDRLSFLDWTRGVAALIMLQGHTFHSFLDKDQRSGDIFQLSQFFGGMPAPIFLFLTGVTLAFLLDGRERRGVDGPGRFAAGLRRAGFLLLLAAAVRLQAFAFAWPWARTEDIFKVDILNCMGVSLALMALTAFFTTGERIKVSLLIGAAIALAAPIVTGLSWASVHPLLRNYLAPNIETFGLFPWAAFTAFGVAFGSMLRVTPKAHLDRFMQWSALFSFGLILSAGYLAALPFSIYRTSQFWLDSPALVFIKIGIILLIICFAYLWLSYVPSRNPSFLTLLGTSSLLVYWVHLELVYGRWLWFWKERLSVPEAAGLSVLLIMAMVGLAALWKRRKEAMSWLLDRFRIGPTSGLPETEPEM